MYLPYFSEFWQFKLIITEINIVILKEFEDCDENKY